MKVLMLILVAFATYPLYVGFFKEFTANLPPYT
jgi:hypothetical protein